MSTVEKSGLHVNAGGEVIGWVVAGSSVEMKEGDVIVSHAKTAKKMGLDSVYASMKAENAPAPVKKEGTRKIVPKTGTYTVVKTSIVEGEDCERKAVAQLLVSNTSLEDFWSKAPEKFKHAGRDGVEKEFSTSGLVAYAIRRGMIEVAA